MFADNKIVSTLNISNSIYVIFLSNTRNFQTTVWFQIIIIMSCHQHGYPWPSLATSPYHSSPLAGLQGYSPYPHRAAVCMFKLVVLSLLGHMWGFIGVHHLWARPCFSSSVLRLTWIVFVIGGWWPYSWWFVGCCLLDLFNISRSVLM